VQGGARFLLVVGASGAGKSSLLKAGLLPQLSRRRREWLVLPTVRPEKMPLEMLAKSLADYLGEPSKWRSWDQMLRDKAAIERVAELVKELRIGDARAATVLLPIDQFEEVFTVATASERADFLKFLTMALDPARDLPIMMIGTGRSDVLEALLEAGELTRFTETYPVPPMPLDRVPRLIEGPAAVAGLNVEKGLSETIARDVESSDALPLLAYALLLLYLRGSDAKRLTLAEYQSLADPARGLNPIQNSVRLVADQAVNSLKPSDVELNSLRDAFVPHLVRLRLDDGKRVRQPARLNELPGESLRLTRALVEARLLTTRGTGDRKPAANVGEAIIEVAHEALFQAWPTLNTWLLEEHAFLSDIERIRSAHEIWVKASNEPGALLGGILLSRARDWLLKHPQRFKSRDMSALHTFVTESITADDLERERREAISAYRHARASALESYVHSLLLDRITSLTEENERSKANRAIPGIGITWTEEFRNNEEIDTLNNFLNPEGRWHPQGAIWHQTAGPQADYADVFRFPCCGKYVVTDTRGPKQFRADGCDASPEAKT
jgi:hypothetical protein